MEWTTCIKEAIKYLEDELLFVKGPEEVAEHIHISPMYLQRGFQIMTGYTIGEYIRNRKLYLAALELIKSDDKIIDLAYKYGYETPESFTKAFVRFHNATPTEVRRSKTTVKTFLPLRVNIVIQGGNSVEFVVEKLAGFKVIGFSREFSFDDALAGIPKFWEEVFNHFVVNENDSTGKSEIKQAMMEHHIGEFGVCIDDIGNNGKFRYMIAGRYAGGTIPSEMEVYEVPEAEWAKFKCLGPMPESMQTVNAQIWNEWLPGNSQFELAGKYNIEWYSSSGSTSDLDYESAIWIPIKKK